ncbi:hypothetical protein [Geobacter sp. DSM 9736]|uniref:hypothetical protein n=1 Tax=Geobacter sp. DSM 9736 TaxID=1277350 RepID=UPI000B4FF780|nr:hypothetical protein [Geobacter sp. DSM 9736]SNB45192.1 hypothetical protein SAMN06269301_0595 [Geobacter sp. DSM 9736]
MKKTTKIVTLAMTLMMAAAGSAMATPSTQIWIPSTDIQPFGVVHLNIDNYFRASGVSKAASPTGRDANVMMIGPTVGILPFEKVQMEIGADYMVVGGEPNDNHPFAFNAKLGTPENSLFDFSPALAVGIYNAGPSQSAANAPLILSGQNIVYGLAAKTLPVIGRISAGGYRGGKSALVDANNPAKSANEGVLLSWDRTMSEISDKLWMAVDYMSGNNVNGAINFGASWAFSKNVSVIFAYDVYKEKALAGNNTFTTQVDINFP